MAAVVIIEDEQRIRELAAKALAARGHEVHTSATAMDGLQTVIGLSPDLVILDLGLPDLDGMELLKMIRAVSDVPVIVATARGEEPDIVLSLNAGADDHLVKPFSVEQLEARVRAVLRRASVAPRGSPVTIGALVIDGAAREASLDGEVLELSAKEFDLLRYLAEHTGEVITKRRLLAEGVMLADEGSSGRLRVLRTECRRTMNGVTDVVNTHESNRSPKSRPSRAVAMRTSRPPVRGRPLTSSAPRLPAASPSAATMTARTSDGRRMALRPDIDRAAHALIPVAIGGGQGFRVTAMPKLAPRSKTVGAPRPTPSNRPADI